MLVAEDERCRAERAFRAWLREKLLTTRWPRAARLEETAAALGVSREILLEAKNLARKRAAESANSVAFKHVQVHGETIPLRVRMPPVVRRDWRAFAQMHGGVAEGYVRGALHLYLIGQHKTTPLRRWLYRGEDFGEKLEDPGINCRIPAGAHRALVRQAGYDNAHSPSAIIRGLCVDLLERKLRVTPMDIAGMWDDEERYERARKLQGRG